ncbi:MAG: sigma 54-interacting transcriptional regulator [Nitrospira sp.]
MNSGTCQRRLYRRIGRSSGPFRNGRSGHPLLDEIGEVPLPMQAKLLRVLQERELERVGDTRTRHVDVRILAATNRDLKQEVDAGRFREDLYYRLSVFPLHVPAARAPRGHSQIGRPLHRAERQADEPPIPRLTQAALSQLTAHTWPGNVRELQNVVERAVILSQGRTLEIQLQSAPAPSPKMLSASAPSASTVATRQELKRQEQENIAQALQLAKGKILDQTVPPSCWV